MGRRDLRKAMVDNASIAAYPMNPDARGIAVLTHGYDSRLGVGITLINTHTLAARPIKGKSSLDNLPDCLNPTSLPVFGQNRKCLPMKLFIVFRSDSFRLS